MASLYRLYRFELLGVSSNTTVIASSDAVAATVAWKNHIAETKYFQTLGAAQTAAIAMSAFRQKSIVRLDTLTVVDNSLYYLPNYVPVTSGESITTYYVGGLSFSSSAANANTYHLSIIGARNILPA